MALLITRSQMHCCITALSSSKWTRL